ncbi:lipopolysaccharide biosynthesis protein [bacterium]
MSVFQNIKRLFKQSAIYGLGHIISRTFHFLLLPLYTNILPREEYGIVGVLFTYIAILMILYTYGMDAAFFRFYILEDGSEDRKRIFSTAFFTILGTSLLFSSILFFGAESIARAVFSREAKGLLLDLPLLIRLAGGILLFDSISYIPFLMLRAKEKPMSFVIYKSLHILLTLAGNIILLVVLKWGIASIFISNLLASCFIFLLLSPMTLRNIGWLFSRKTLVRLMKFGAPFIPLNLAFVIMDMLDRPLLERLAGIESAGLFNAGAKLGMFLALIVAAFRYAWSPFFLSTSKQKDAREIYSRVLTYTMLVCGAVFLAISLFIDHIVQIRLFGFVLIGEAYWSSTVVVPVLMLASLFYAAYSNFLVGMYLMKKTHILPVITTAGMAGSIIANLILIPQYNILGAAWARVIAYGIMAILLFIIAQHFYPVRYEWIRILKCSIVTGGLFLLGQLEGIWNHLLIKALLLLCFPLFLLMLGFFSRSELKRFRAVLSARFRHHRAEK